MKTCKFSRTSKRGKSFYLNDFSWVVIGDGSGPPSADALSSVDEHHREDGHVELGLNFHVVVLEIIQNVVIVWVENVPRQRTHFSEDVTRRGAVFATGKP